MNEQALRETVVDTCRRMNALGINQGTSGNVSARHGTGMLVSPSGVPYDRLGPETVVRVDADGSWGGEFRPSSEWRIHRDLLRERSDINAVVHAHPVYCTVLAIRRMEIPPLHYMIAAAGGSNIRCANYATFGTAELSENVLQAMRGRDACLLANHGVLAVGHDLERALWLAVEVEALARQYVLSLQIGGPTLLTNEEIERVLAKFSDYGHRRADARHER
jgi:L-fuculose-phosphate aldolase